ncbi:hypothetical protein V0M98_34290 (plasmid) [Pseudomonas silesiensis]|uniref:hypothetical protein n=1 Tax=Pseudomonas silesiensis TaxID=1853130 RepID=UPI0030CFA5F1
MIHHSAGGFGNCLLQICRCLAVRHHKGGLEIQATLSFGPAMVHHPKVVFKKAEQDVYHHIGGFENDDVLDGRVLFVLHLVGGF